VTSSSAKAQRVEQLNDSLRNITDQANPRIVALFDEYFDLTFSGQWRA
jgi:hypothetical protein